MTKSSKQPASIARLTGSLLRFQHTRALSEALRVVVAPETATAAVVAVVRELSRRATLGAAVAGQSESDMKRLLRFIRLNIWHPRLTPTCVHLLRTLTSKSLLIKLLYIKLQFQWRNRDLVHEIRYS